MCTPLAAILRFGFVALRLRLIALSNMHRMRNPMLANKRQDCGKKFFSPSHNEYPVKID